MPKVILGKIAQERRETCSGDKSSYPVVGLEHLTPGEVRLSAWADGGDNTFTKRFYKGDVLFGRRRAYLKKAAQAPFDGVCSGDITVIKPISGKVLPELLPFIIQNDSFFKYAIRNSAGSLSPRVKWSALENYEINLPSADEQGRLAELLWAAIDLKASYQRSLAASDDLVKSRFNEMFGTPDNNPKGYAVKTLSEISSIITGSTPSTHNSDYWEGDYPWVSAQDMKGKYIHETVDKLTQSGYDTCKKVPPNSILFVCRGSIGTMAITAIECAVNQSICAATALKGVTHEYLYTALMMQKEKIQRIGCGTSFKSINQSTFSKIKVIVPPIPLQNEFIAFVEQIDKSKFALTQALADLDKTIKGILNQALEA